MSTTTVVVVSTTTTTAGPTSTSTPAPAPHPGPSVWYLVSVTAALPDGLVASLGTIPGVDAISTATVGTLHLVESRDASGTVVDEPPDGFVIPLEAQAFDPPGRSGWAPEPVERLLAGLSTGEAVLSSSSGTLRGLGPGAELLLEGGTKLLVVGVVDDEWVGAAEVVVSPDDARALGITNERYSVVRYDGARSTLEQEVDALVDASVRIRTRDEVDVFRHADAVASQLAIKIRFGEFAYRPIGGGAIKIDPAWVSANIVHAHLPLLGGITCHRDFVAMLREVMGTLQAGGHADAIDRSAYRGCWNPRFIRQRRDLSSHAWGVATDINFGNELHGDGSPTDPDLIAAMEAVDILSGHAWTDPGPGHFEWFPPDG